MEWRAMRGDGSYSRCMRATRARASAFRELPTTGDAHRVRDCGDFGDDFERARARRERTMRGGGKRDDATTTMEMG